MQSRDVFKNEKNLDKAFCKHSKGMVEHIIRELYEEDVKNNK